MKPKEALTAVVRYLSLLAAGLLIVDTGYKTGSRHLLTNAAYISATADRKSDVFRKRLDRRAAS